MWECRDIWLCWCCQGSARCKQLEQPPLLKNLPWGSFANLTRSTGRPGPSVRGTDASAAECQQLCPHPGRDAATMFSWPKFSRKRETSPQTRTERLCHVFLLNIGHIVEHWTQICTIALSPKRCLLWPVLRVILHHRAVTATGGQDQLHDSPLKHPHQDS